MTKRWKCKYQYFIVRVNKKTNEELYLREK